MCLFVLTSAFASPWILFDVHRGLEAEAEVPSWAVFVFFFSVPFFFMLSHARHLSIE
jgi:hypothetical protein